jgi:hypothetical protein
MPQPLTLLNLLKLEAALSRKGRGQYDAVSVLRRRSTQCSYLVAVELAGHIGRSRVPFLRDGAWDSLDTWEDCP